MTWFKVDDSFYDHPKIFDAPDCAVALWVRAGSWSARNLTDGHVPAKMPARLCDDPERATRELVDRGLWRRTKGGYQFHDWTSYQPTRSEATATQSRKSTGGKLGNHRRWHVARGVVDPTCRYCAPSDSDRSSDRSDGGSDSGTDACAIPYRSSVNPNVRTADASLGSEKSQADAGGRSDIRSVSDRSSDRYANPPVPSRPEGTRTDTGSQSSSRRNARAWADDDDSIDLGIVELLTELTGREISILDATKIRQRILGRRNVDRRAAYVASAIEDNPRKFLPVAADDPPADDTPPLRAVPEWCGHCDPHDRTLELADGKVARCQECNPHAKNPFTSREVS